MTFDQLIRERKSIRGYKTDPIPQSIVEEIIETAKWAPSSMNTQPWYTEAPRRPRRWEV